MSDYKEFESKMKKTCEALNTQLATIRAGRANASVLDQIEVDYYGVPTPVQQVATIATPDPRSLLIQPWDASLLKSLTKRMPASCWLQTKQSIDWRKSRRWVAMLMLATTA